MGVVLTPQERWRTDPRGGRDISYEAIAQACASHHIGPKDENGDCVGYSAGYIKNVFEGWNRPIWDLAHFIAHILAGDAISTDEIMAFPYTRKPPKRKFDRKTAA